MAFFDYFRSRERIPADIRQALEDPKALERLDKVLNGEDQETTLKVGAVEYRVVLDDSSVVNAPGSVAQPG